MRRLSLRRVGYFVAPYLLSPLSVAESVRFAAVDVRRRIHPPPIFIIGAPRTGSTVLYQAITHYFEVGYISNLASLFVRSLWLGDRLHDRLYRGVPHQCFRSTHGRTIGMNSPSESGKFWYRWFPRDNHYVTPESVDLRPMIRLRQTIAAITEDSQRPMVFKNLNCGQRLQVLREVLPESLFVVIVRDPLQTAASILKSRIDRYGNPERWFSVMPRDVNRLRLLPYPAQIAGQVHQLESQIEADLGLFSSKQSIWIHYDDLCQAPAAILERLAVWAAVNGVHLRVRPGARVPELRRSRGPEIGGADIEALASEIARLHWGSVHERRCEPIGSGE